MTDYSPQIRQIKRLLARLERRYRSVAFRSQDVLVAAAECEKAFEELMEILHDHHVSAALDLLISRNQPRVTTEATSMRLDLRSAVNRAAFAAREVQLSHGATCSKVTVFNDIAVLYRQLDDKEHLQQICSDIGSVDDFRNWIVGRHIRILRGIERARRLNRLEKKQVKRVIRERLRVTTRGIAHIVTNTQETHEVGLKSYALGLSNLCCRMQDVHAMRMRIPDNDGAIPSQYEMERASSTATTSSV